MPHVAGDGWQVTRDKLENGAPLNVCGGTSALALPYNIFVLTSAPDGGRLLQRLHNLGATWARIANVDFRNATTDELLRAGRIGVNAAITIDEGRTRKRDFPSPGAVGCYWSHVLALRMADPREWTLVLEDDLHIDRTRMFLAAICQMMRQSHKARQQQNIPMAPDAFVLAPILLRMSPDWSALPLSAAWAKESVISPPMERLGVRWLTRTAFFQGTAAMLWSPEGRRRMLAALGHRPAEVQIDAALTFLQRAGLLTVAVRPWGMHRGNRSKPNYYAYPGHDVEILEERNSQVQGSSKCPLCDKNPGSHHVRLRNFIRRSSREVAARYVQLMRARADSRDQDDIAEIDRIGALLLPIDAWAARILEFKKVRDARLYLSGGSVKPGSLSFAKQERGSGSWIPLPETSRARQHASR